ncbi:methyl-accepting chemotaxis protein [Pseudomonas benzenivorans]|uniref:Methyl-accepting chemotaxis protein n=2 Tax=Pseudomonas benzenivorans TaxID=556533 RepID=A0ABZ0PZ10_9PSED|nr:methyl-accepting chemotaxis protein [Pseudomonas benzenivorans]WPC06171.1 methyl-accepting chemotaxis protein [Pseudomonas benzenivorans]
MNVLQRLSFTGKFVLLGTLALGLILVPTSLYLLDTLKSGRQAERELRGVAPVRALLQLVALTQQHRDLSASLLGGDASLQAARQAKQAELQRAFEAGEQALHAADVGADLLATWQQLGEQWRELSAQLEQGELGARQSLQHHGQLIAASLLLEDALLDRFELALDPVLDTYSLMNAALIEMPQAAELFGRLRGYGALYLAQGHILPEQQGALMGLSAQALASAERMSRAFAKATAADPALAALLEAPLQALNAQSQQALELTDQQLISALELDFSSGGAGLKLSYPLADYLAAYARPIDGLQAIGDAALAALEQKLGERRDDHRRHSLLMSAALLTLLLLGGGVAALIVLRLLAQLNEAMAAAERIAKGDLSRPLTSVGSDEAARLLQALQRMQSDLRATVEQIVSSSQQLASASGELSTVTEGASQGLQRQCEELDQAATAVTELTTAIEEVARNAVSTAEVSRSADQCSRQGQDSVVRTVAAIEALAADIERTAQALQALAGYIDDIGSVLDVIRAIAEQTNLLALNAAIEAARAGESGRGFAVVADEVRALARRTQDSTQQIESIIGAVQQGSQQALQAMRSSDGRTRETLEVARAAGAALQRIVGAITEINERNLCIASATEQQSQVAREVDRNLLNIREVAALTSSGADRTQASSRQLAGLAGEMSEMVRHFVV